MLKAYPNKQNDLQPFRPQVRAPPASPGHTLCWAGAAGFDLRLPSLGHPVSTFCPGSGVVPGYTSIPIKLGLSSHTSCRWLYGKPREGQEPAHSFLAEL